VEPTIDSGRSLRGLAFALLTLALVLVATALSAAAGARLPARSAASGASGASSATGVAAPRSITIEWVGDIAFGEAYGLPPGGLTGALAPVRHLLHSDLTMGNLETTLAVGGEPKCASIGASNCFAYQAPPDYAEQLRHVGFDLMNDANNHALDFGLAGRGETLAALRNAGLAYAALPGQITRLRINGISVAVVAFAPYSWTNNLLDIPAAEQLVRRARREARIVIVIIHAGAEGASEDHVPHGTEYDYGEDRGDSRAFAHAVIDAGASIVVGSGPHVIRGIQRYRDRMIAYSLGNFASWDNLARGGTLSLSAILRVTLSPDGAVLAGRWIPIELVGPGLPRYDPSGASTQLVRQLSREDFGAARYDIQADGVIEPDPPR
jgi:poly-gamma-glutamate capsule biosynthesis protein CapA/YwtB (metallophosphatase superfamily)